MECRAPPPIIIIKSGDPREGTVLNTSTGGIHIGTYIMYTTRTNARYIYADN